ncbi:hypothetical protein A3K34_00445 [candidate division WWE3 bacterium RIFOXYC1_FULL_40_10]|uniref:Uncharacterized protein n=1 Tax=candidate division WWE3 bacterium RIFOXYA2_FULL_46_9 TaxID=1802636 RepID=A0A1F4VYX5_UNCKA|nr:MAG: hypothetical protein A3K58_00445 [candidate division WWE3 bacterium RIFOXYB1_FULL_40_22]OGC61354.1 MAG: hypothetical protein A3K37_00445 [candidate division WWE3 bacterium RIFOXYA1_FULL_40_11]OGC62362.1 MAG: hypothetical protein A2264_05340 [candidate division WWE3 bacterium RIFOXYA2_FULL_46_9]OGC65344.1 MAG: hypothetical protein A2326_04730 [candidate division WWE3 bacterium RIFOXYB2_FULL_41_6]OGC65737.1 MAG: hypothetical protein A3K34_00445 [candidate division WWE3 bacterium RIFOXYC1_
MAAKGSAARVVRNANQNVRPPVVQQQAVTHPAPAAPQGARQTKWYQKLPKIKTTPSGSGCWAALAVALGFMVLAAVVFFFAFFSNPGKSKVPAPVIVKTQPVEVEKEVVKVGEGEEDSQPELAVEVASLTGQAKYDAIMNKFERVDGGQNPRGSNLNDGYEITIGAGMTEMVFGHGVFSLADTEIEAKQFTDAENGVYVENITVIHNATDSEVVYVLTRETATGLSYHLLKEGESLTEEDEEYLARWPVGRAPHCGMTNPPGCSFVVLGHIQIIEEGRLKSSDLPTGKKFEKPIDAGTGAMASIQLLPKAETGWDKVSGKEAYATEYRKLAQPAEEWPVAGSLDPITIGVTKDAPHLVATWGVVSLEGVEVGSLPSEKGHYVAFLLVNDTENTVTFQVTKFAGSGFLHYEYGYGQKPNPDFWARYQINRLTWGAELVSKGTVLIIRLTATGIETETLEFTTGLP